MSKITLGLLQHACSPKPAENLKKALALAEKAAKQGANIICTQELFRSQYFCQSEDHDNFKLAEPIPGPSTEALGKVAREHKVVIVASLFEKRSAGAGSALIRGLAALAAPALPCCRSRRYCPPARRAATAVRNVATG